MVVELSPLTYIELWSVTYGTINHQKKGADEKLVARTDYWYQKIIANKNCSAQ